MALSSSKEEPQPLSTIVKAVGDWVGRLGEVWVRAQITEIRRRNAPVQFLTLADPDGEFTCSATTTTRVLDIAGPLPEGANVVARITPRLYVPRSQLNFEILELHVAGEGQLLAQLEQLKRTLQAEGLFNPELKKPLPFLPKLIGLITGKDSDAERDVLRNVELRWPAARIRTHYALVQGDKAVESVLQALTALDNDAEVDVIIIARGGGSLQDLLPFSDEYLVRAVAAAKTPVIAAIGHEPDQPLLDLVADVRASTPTDAAKIVVPDVSQEFALIYDSKMRIRLAVHNLIRREQQYLSDLRSRPVLLNPTRAFDAHYEKLALLRHQLRNSVNASLQREEAEVHRLLTTLRAMSPKKTLERGYAVLASEESTITSTEEATVGQHIKAYLHDGTLDLEVSEITERSRDG